MNTIEATFRIVTPMFIGGADPNGKAELRPPSIKGALRFWYRAFDPDYKKNESKIFGGAGKDEGQSCFSLCISDKNIKAGNARDVRWDGKKIAYLGYGLINRESTGNKIKDKDGNEKEEKKSMTLRSYIAAGSTFTLSIRFKQSTSEEYKSFVKKSLWALVMMGGLGSRSRKGFGSIVVTGNIKGMNDLPSLMPTNKKELVSSLKEFLEKMPRPSGLVEYTSWSKGARCVVSGDSRTGEDALEWVGREMHAYRSWRGEKKFQPDHDKMRDFILSGKNPNTPPLRAAFGLPHNYFYTSLGNKKGGVDFMDGEKAGRRASPLLLRIHEFKDDSKTANEKVGACIVATYLPARLIPNGKTVRVSGEGQINISLPLADNFIAVKDFVDRLSSKGEEVKP